VPREHAGTFDKGFAMAKNTVVVTEDDLEEQFKDDKKFAVQLLDSEYRERMRQYIKSICRYLSDDDIFDVYQQSLREFIRCVQKPDFDPHKPLRLIQRIIKFRTIDLARRRKGSRIRNVGDLIEVLAKNLKDTTVNLEWRMILREEWPRFRKALDKAVDDLPPKQRTTALAFLEVYEVVEEESSYRALAERIREMTGDDCTTVQAYDNWRVARKTIAAKLCREKFNLLIEE
jgi:DNA-directed RNA polymerase specialized sigma24 family protein